MNLTGTQGHLNTAPANEPLTALPIALPYLTRIRGKDSEGRKFKEYVVLDHISTNGLQVRLQQKLKPGIQLSIIVRLSLQPEWQVSAQYLAVRGKVLSVAPQSDGTNGIKVSFTRCRFI